jgi:hypothetical protein
VKATYKLTGIRPLIMHNGRLADPLDSFAKKLKKLTGERKKTDTTHAALAEVEWEGSLYWSDTLGLYLPNAMLEAMFEDAAAKLRLRDAVKAGIFVDADFGVPLRCEHSHNLERLRADPRYRIRTGVVVQRSRVMRTRAMIPTGWTAEVLIDFDESLLNLDQVSDVLTKGGAHIGLGTWRPKFGRFITEIQNGKR